MTRLIRTAAAMFLTLALVPVTGAAEDSQAWRSKLKGGLDGLVRLGFQPDQRLDYLVPDFRRGDFLVYVVTDGLSRNRVADIKATGAVVRWRLRSIPAVSVLATAGVIEKLASRRWVRALYPVSSGRIDDTTTDVDGQITRSEPRRTHKVVVAAASGSITVDLTVTPPTPPHVDINAIDFLEARLVSPEGRVVMVRPSLLHQIAFRYAENGPLQSGNWTLEMLYRKANQPTTSIPFSYSGSITVAGEQISPPAPAEIPGGCSGPAEANRWKNHANLRRRSVTDIGAPVLWDAGIRGRGVRVAVLDSGTDGTHADLDDQDWERWDASDCAPKIIADALFVAGRRQDGEGAADVGGHGTHVSGEVAGTAEGATDEERGAYPGVAPESSLIAGRIAIDVTALSDDMIAGAEWAVIDQQADVVNISYGIDVRYGVLTDQNDPQSAAFEALAINPAWGRPTIVASAGNSGDLFRTVAIPGTSPHVLTAAATVKDWDLVLGEGETMEAGTATRGAKDAHNRVHPSIALFSSRGPTHDFGFAPDIAAPGRSIVAAATNQEPGDTEPDSYASFSGTSMAAPHTAGAAALLVDGYRQRFGTAGSFGNRPPSWLVSAALMNTAGTPAERPAFAGGRLRKVDYTTGTDGLFLLYGEEIKGGATSRENLPDPIKPVGPLVEGAGRVNLPGALSALTEGVTIWTGGSESNPAPEDLQPSISFGALKPLLSGSQDLVLHPATSHAYDVTFAAVSGPASLSGRVIKPEWWSIPGATTVEGGKASRARVGLTVPSQTPAGDYTGYLLADVRDRANGKRWTLRLPALLVVEVVQPEWEVDLKKTGPAIVEARMNAVEDSPYIPLLVTGPVNNDWPMYVFEVPKGAERVEMTLEGTGNTSLDEWDLFVYDNMGLEVASSFLAIPSGSASLTMDAPSPGFYRVAVSPTLVDKLNQLQSGPTERPYRLTIEVASLGIRIPEDPPRPKLPDTGAGAGALGLGLAAVALVAARRLRRT